MITSALISAAAVTLAAIFSALASWLTTRRLQASTGRRYLKALKIEIQNILEFLEHTLSNPHDNPTDGARYEFYAYQVPQKYAPVYLAYSNSFGEPEDYLVTEVFDFYSKLLNMKHAASTASGHIRDVEKSDLEESIRRAKRALAAVKERLGKD